MSAILAIPAETGMAKLQRSFAEALFFADAPIPAAVRQASGPAHASRFGVYRNNVAAGLIIAVAARYPVVRRLLWDDVFNRIAWRYVASDPPRSPVLLEYGETFPGFLRSIAPSPSANYLADIGELESARTRAYHAADASPVPRAAFRAVPIEELPELRLMLHPSVSIVRSDFPIVSAWEANLYANDNTLSVWRPECALIVRPHLDVDVRVISRDTCEFIAGLADGLTVADAIGRCASRSPGFDLAECFNVVVSADIVTGLVLPESCM